jgi:osmotically-inducible protein OsmY
MGNVTGRMSGGEGNQDTSLIDLVRSQLSDMFPAARGLQINASEGKLTLSGLVPATDYDRIIETVCAIPGVTQFDNQLQTAGT